MAAGGGRSGAQQTAPRHSFLPLQDSQELLHRQAFATLTSAEKAR